MQNPTQPLSPGGRLRCLSLLSDDTPGSWLRGWDYLTVTRTEALQRKIPVSLRSFKEVEGNHSLRDKEAKKMGKRNLVCGETILRQEEEAVSRIRRHSGKESTVR